MVCDAEHIAQDRLPPARFELMIWRLETTNAAAIDRTFAAAGAQMHARVPTRAADCMVQS